ncbi:MAG TPA: MotA/TolQ/ExbB proton channel family protein [Sedimentisphaerales bacterium]|nr:MotA/TolQ/ExbB proton channel family protein [Sedimentisphaerales bacterium]
MMKRISIIAVLLILLFAVVLAVIFISDHLPSQTGSQPKVERQTFFQQFVVAGGPIVWFILLPMSLTAMYFAIDYSLTICRKKLVPQGIGSKIAEVIQNTGHRNLKQSLSEKEDFVSIAVLEATAKGKSDWFRIKSVLAESFQDQALILLRRIEWINLIGNVSPMVGLFGTVFGMIKLFDAIVVAGGQPQPAVLADGISVALVTTFWGLVIAIPSLAVHGVFRNRIETLVSEAVVEADDVMAQIKISLKKELLQTPAGKEKL